MHRILNSTSRIGRLLAILLALAVIGVPNLVGTSRTITYADGHGGVPAGQLVRKSLVGTISSLSGSSMTISTPHGAVSVGIGGAQVNAPPDKDVGTSALAVGQKVVVNLNRSPVDPDKLKKDKDDDDEPDGSGTATTTDDGSGSTGGNATTTTDDGSGSTGG
ncbi:MAG: hypothetical protein IIC24_10860, partial [Chloroflexi bacterium]|nr:hypothetical protein [Chloroflexota bacterium]